MIDTEDLCVALSRYLPRQRWFGNKDRTLTGVRDVAQEVLSSGTPALVWVTATVELDHGPTARYHVPLGLHHSAPPGCDDHATGLLGPVATEAGRAMAYDAAVDSEVAQLLMGVVAPDERVAVMRPMGGEQSNTSLVFDERLIMKLYRRPPDGPNPDAEVTAALAETGFLGVAPVVARWRVHDTDRAIVQPFLQGGVDGWASAVASLASGRGAADFVDEAARLGAVTAHLHAALADAFGTHRADADGWAETVARQVERTGDARIDNGRVGDVLDALRKLEDVGHAIRTHGDYHLGQVLWSGDRWYVLDFEGEPARPLAERLEPSSPLKDVAGMLRSFDYASQVAVMEASADAALALRWQAANREAFLDAYARGVAGQGLVPDDNDAFDAVLTTFELEKAIYEVGYEAANRPAWVAIPLAAVARLLENV